MKNIILSLAFISLIGFANAANEGKDAEAPAIATVTTVSLNGKVIDFNSGEALTGVEVCIEGTSIKAYTDFDGNFEISNVKPGKYNLIASYISYNKSLIENFKVEEVKNTVDIKLQTSN